MAAFSRTVLSFFTSCTLTARAALVVPMPAVTWPSLTWAPWYCWLRADIWAWAEDSSDSIWAALALASETESAPTGRETRTTVLEHTVTTVITGKSTRRSSRPLRSDRGAEWLGGRSTSVTMADILIGPIRGLQTLTALHPYVQSYYW